MKQNQLKISYINIFVGLMIIMVGFMGISQFVDNDVPDPNADLTLVLIAGGMAFGGFMMGKYGLAVIDYHKKAKQSKWR